MIPETRRIREWSDAGWFMLRVAVAHLLARVCRWVGPWTECSCYECGRPYGERYGFPDLLIPNWAWREITYEGEGDGLLCPSCITERLHAAGLERVPHWFTSGPLCMGYEDVNLNERKPA